MTEKLYAEQKQRGPNKYFIIYQYIKQKKNGKN